MTVEELRTRFPQLKQTVYGKPLVYLDNAATSLRPQSVLDSWMEMSVRDNANIYRAVHKTAANATAKVEDAREAVRRFIGAQSREEVIFTAGTTDSINLLAFSFGEAFVKEGDEIILSAVEHHADIVPWQMMCRRKGACIKVLPVDDSGHLQLEYLERMITPRTRLVCVSHISNVLGLVNPVGEIVRTAHAKGCPVLIDGAQGIVHSKVDVKALDCDFYAFSGHKIFAATGTGILYGKKEWMEKLPPYQGGGEMIDTVRWEGTSYAPSPLKFEAGTRNFASIPTFTQALALAEECRSKEIEDSQRQITSLVTDALKQDGRIKLFGEPSVLEEKIPLFSFCVQGAHHEDLALILDKMGVAARSGQMCAEPLMDRFGVTGMLRVSFGAYNTVQEAEYFLESLQKAIGMLV